MRPSHDRMAAFLRRAWDRLAPSLDHLAFARQDEHRDRVRSAFGSKFRSSADRQVGRMVDLYGWRRVADAVPIEVCDRLLRLAMAEEDALVGMLDDARTCPDCGGRGWYAKYPANGDPPEQQQCGRCGGDGAVPGKP